MRYFKTTNASRRYLTGGLAFSFEPVDQTGGGSWLGVLEVEQSAASILTAAQIPQISEITPEEYEAQKKKPLSRSSSSRVLPGPPPSPLLPPKAADPAEPTAPPAPTPSAVSGPGVVLKTKILDVPDELKLVTGAKSVKR